MSADPRLCARLEEVITVELDDDRLAWTLDGSGAWTRVPASRGVDTHAELARRARARTQ
jgi:hypothetical protein